MIEYASKVPSKQAVLYLPVRVFAAHVSCQGSLRCQKEPETSCLGKARLRR
jgi:hypothetical protein